MPIESFKEFTVIKPREIEHANVLISVANNTCNGKKREEKLLHIIYITIYIIHAYHVYITGIHYYKIVYARSSNNDYSVPDSLVMGTSLVKKSCIIIKYPL